MISKVTCIQAPRHRANKRKSFGWDPDERSSNGWISSYRDTGLRKHDQARDQYTSSYRHLERRCFAAASM
eukprot:scaffold5612_cov150-Amphora_coffeaeformis.AAC.8